MAFDKFDQEKMEKKRAAQSDLAQKKHAKVRRAIQDLIAGEDIPQLEEILHDVPRLLQLDKDVLAYQVFLLAYKIFPDDYSVEEICDWIIVHAL